MSALHYILTVTDEHGNTIHRVMHTSHTMLVMELPQIKANAEKYLESKKNTESLKKSLNIAKK